MTYVDKSKALVKSLINDPLSIEEFSVKMNLLATYTNPLFPEVTNLRLRELLKRHSWDHNMDKIRVTLAMLVDYPYKRGNDYKTFVLGDKIVYVFQLILLDLFSYLINTTRSLKPTSEFLENLLEVESMLKQNQNISAGHELARMYGNHTTIISSAAAENLPLSADVVWRLLECARDANQPGLIPRLIERHTYIPRGDEASLLIVNGGASLERIAYALGSACKPAAVYSVLAFHALEGNFLEYWILLRAFNQPAAETHLAALNKKLGTKYTVESLKNNSTIKNAPSSKDASTVSTLRVASTVSTRKDTSTASTSRDASTVSTLRDASISKDASTIEDAPIYTWEAEIAWAAWRIANINEQVLVRTQYPEYIRWRHEGMIAKLHTQNYYRNLSSELRRVAERRYHLAEGLAYLSQQNL